MTTWAQSGNRWFTRVLSTPLHKQRQPLIQQLKTPTKDETRPKEEPLLDDPLAQLRVQVQQLQVELREAYTTLQNRVQDNMQGDLSNQLQRQLQEKIQALQEQDYVLRWTGQARQQQLSQMLSTHDAQANRTIHRQANLEMGSSIIAATLAGVGVLGLPMLSWLSVPFNLYAASGPIKRSVQKLQQGEATTDQLVSLAIIGSMGCGYFFVSGLNVLIFRLGTKLELAVKDHSKQNLIDTFRQQTTTVWVLVEGVEMERPFNTLQKGDIVIVHAGETVPVDGVIQTGYASVDQRILTGEARPVERTVGGTLFAATLMLSGRVELCVEKTGQETAAGQIGDILNKTVNFKSEMQLRGQKFADRTVLPTLLLGVAVSSILGFESFVAILNAHFKNRVSMVVPVSLLHFLNRAAKAQVLIKDGRSLDLLQKVDTLVFDKTGTLTEEQPKIAAIHICASCSESEVLAYAAAAEYKQTHPIARAILAAATTRQLPVPELDHASYKVGYGLTVQLQKDQVRVGSHNFMQNEGLSLPSSLQEIQEHAHEEGHTLVWVALNEAVIGAIELAPSIRPEAKAVIHELRQRGKIKNMCIISGDSLKPTQKLANELGIEQVFAEVLPEQKANIIAQLQAEGKSICYVGDGINDVIALKKAEVSISLRGAATVATDIAQIILMEQSLRRLPYLFQLSDEFHRHVNQCLAVLLTISGASIASVLFLNAGIVASAVMMQVNLFASMATALAPMLQDSEPPPLDEMFIEEANLMDGKTDKTDKIIGVS